MDQSPIDEHWGRLVLHKIHKVKNSPSSYIWHRVTVRIRRLAIKYRDVLCGTEISDKKLLRSFNNRFDSLEEFFDHLRNRQTPIFFISHPTDNLKRELSERFPQIKHLTIMAADNIIVHDFDLLGSGLTHLGKEVDWHTDFSSGYRWSPDTYYLDIKRATFPGGFDIKIPWEISRFHHVVWLGQAYWFTGDEKYVSEFSSQILDWIKKNPHPYGVNWSSPMDVSIRVVNWLWGLNFFINSKELSTEFLSAFVKSLFLHGKHILDNLEIYRTSRGRLTSNHYLSNLVGLVYLGILFPEFRVAEKWLKIGLTGLEQEMFQQVMEDGVDYESSTSYHRLVTELFLSASLLAKLNGYSLSTGFMERLEKMIEFIQYLTKPDGKIPLIGDNDDGRIHRLKVWKNKADEWIDFRYLLAIGSYLFERRDFASDAEDHWEEAFWFFGEKIYEYMNVDCTVNEGTNQLDSREFNKGGIYIIRHGDHYLSIDAGTNGQKGFGGHAHNDIFSFELYSGGKTWIVDPGTYVYTSDFNQRNLFRSTAYHNTVVVDGQEQNAINSQQLFRLESDAVVKVIDWINNDKYTFFFGEHYGYARLPERVIHQRMIFFDKELELWIVQDMIKHSPKATMIPATSYLHLAHQLNPIVYEEISGVIHIYGNTREFLEIRVITPAVLKTNIEATSVSPSYGVRQKAYTVSWEWHEQSQFIIGLYNDDFDKSDLSHINKAKKNFNSLLSNINFG